MKQFLVFFLLTMLGSKAFGQVEFSTKPIKIIPLKVKPKKDIEPKSNAPKFELPKIVAPNIFKETNIFGTKPKPNNSFQIGVPENRFSLASNNKFAHKLGDVYQDVRLYLGPEGEDLSPIATGRFTKGSNAVEGAGRNSHEGQ